MGFVVDKVALEQVFSRVLRFPLPILIPLTAPHSSGIGTMGQLKADLPSELTQSHPTPRNYKKGASYLVQPTLLGGGEVPRVFEFPAGV
jgi:hypothetical protein